MFQLLIIVGIVVIEFCVLEEYFIRECKDYQGFSNEIFSPSNNSTGSTGSVIF